MKRALKGQSRHQNTTNQCNIFLKLKQTTATTTAATTSATTKAATTAAATTAAATEATAAATVRGLQ